MRTRLAERALHMWLFSKSREVRTEQFKGQFICTAHRLFPEERTVCTGCGKTPEEARTSLAVNGYRLGHW
jgi:hypothetical protein